MHNKKTTFFLKIDFFFVKINIKIMDTIVIEYIDGKKECGKLIKTTKDIKNIFNEDKKKEKSFCELFSDIMNSHKK